MQETSESACAATLFRTNSESAVGGGAVAPSVNEKQTCTQMTSTLNSSTATDSVLTNDAQDWYVLLPVPADAY